MSNIGYLPNKSEKNGWGLHLSLNRTQSFLFRFDTAVLKERWFTKILRIFMSEDHPKFFYSIPDIVKNVSVSYKEENSYTIGVYITPNGKYTGIHFFVEQSRVFPEVIDGNVYIFSNWFDDRWSGGWVFGTNGIARVYDTWYIFKDGNVTVEYSDTTKKIISL